MESWSRPEWQITDEVYASFSKRQSNHWHWSECPIWWVWVPVPNKPGKELPIHCNREQAVRDIILRLTADAVPYRVELKRDPHRTLEQFMSDPDFTNGQVSPLKDVPTTPVGVPSVPPAGFPTEPPFRHREPVIGPALREALKDPANAEAFASFGNALAGALQSMHPAPEETPPAMVSAEDFAKVDLRVGTVVTAERVPKSDKMLKLGVDLAEEMPRVILAGIGKTFTPETMVGQQVVVVANLPPRKMFGVESSGMVLATGGDPSTLSLVQPSTAVPAGSRLR